MSRARRENDVLVADRSGKVVENWTQWDKLWDGSRGPHHIKINPYDPDKHVWIIDDDLPTKESDQRLATEICCSVNTVQTSTRFYEQMYGEIQAHRQPLTNSARLKKSKPQERNPFDSREDDR